MKRENGIWGDEPELIAASQLLKFNFVVYNSQSLQVRYQHHYSSDSLTMYLEFYNANHYNVLELKKKPIKIELKQKDNKIEEMDNLNNLKKTLTYDTKEVINLKKQNTNSMESHNELNLSIKDKNNPIPTENQKEGITLYMKAKSNKDTYNKACRYLKYNIIPNRLTSADSIKNWKKSTEKRFYLAPSPKSKISQSKLVFRSEKNNKVTIPLKTEIPKIFAKAHNNFSNFKTKHNGINITFQNIKAESLYWTRMKQDIEEYINLCPDCIELKPEKTIKSSKTIETV